MITAHQAFEAEKDAKAQRLSFATLLCLDESKKASPEDLHLAKMVLEVSRTDQARYEKALGTQSVNALFARGILRFSLNPKPFNSPPVRRV